MRLKTLLIVFILLFIAFFVFNLIGVKLEENPSINQTTSVSQTVNVRDKYKIFPEVWSQNSPYGQSYEFKVNCFGNYQILNECFLWDIDEVRLISPNNTIYSLNKDFNVNNYSGEVTRRWVLYGPYNGSLPLAGNYTFQYIENGSVSVTDTVTYGESLIGYPTEVDWERRGKDLYVDWNPPSRINEGVFYKVIVWEEEDTPDTFVSNRFNWNATDAILPDVPFIEGGNYSVNVAVYFRDGYAFSEYVLFEW